MRRQPRTTRSLFALIATACAVAPTASALATTTGGAGAPAPTPAPHKAQRSAIATWFGPGFYGHKTACGQTLTPEVIGVANRTLPCGTLVKVSYHGHTLTVPVLDRGPYSHIGADWDLTAGAAQALEISETVRIRTRIVGSAPNTPALGAPSQPASSPQPTPSATSASVVTGGAVAAST